jgi:hypothetical protein
MRVRGTWVVVAGTAAAAVVAVVVVGLALGGSGSPPSRAEYANAVVNTRDRVDFALGRLSKAQSVDDLLIRMDEAASTIRDAAGDLDRLGAPDALAVQHKQLVDQLRTLSTDVQGTADQARVPGFDEILLGEQGLNWDSWDSINTVLAQLRQKGIKVQPLARHATT